MSSTPLYLPHLRTKKLGRVAYHFADVGSTQDHLKQMALEGASEGTVVLADRQLSGRGRQGRRWFSLPQPQIFSSILICPPVPRENLPIVNIVAGLAVAEALQIQGVSDVQIKWPNDVFLKGKKVAGILSETIELPKSRQATAIILGIGVNVLGKMEDFPEELRNRAITLEMLLPSPDRFSLFSDILFALEEWIEELSLRGSNAVQSEFKERWIYSRRPLKVNLSQRTVFGIASEIDTDGALLLHTKEGDVLRVLSGDIELADF